MKILYFNNSNPKNCGIYQYGLRLADILTKSNYFECNYYEISSIEEHNNIIQNTKYDLLLYNYNPTGYTLWYTDIYKQQTTGKKIGIMHSIKELFEINIMAAYIIDDIKGLKYSIPRIIYNINNFQNQVSKSIEDFINYKEYNTPIFGTFGFSTKHNFFDKIIELINNQYDNAIIKISCSKSYCVDDTPIVNSYKNIKRKPGIKILIINDFLSTNDLLKFLNSNDCNIFLYYDGDIGHASTIDYAISVNKPIAISNYPSFDHIYDDTICVEKNTLQEIIDYSQDYLDKKRIEWSSENVCKKFKQIFDESLN